MVEHLFVQHNNTADFEISDDDDYYYYNLRHTVLIFPFPLLFAFLSHHFITISYGCKTTFVLFNLPVPNIITVKIVSEMKQADERTDMTSPLYVNFKYFI
jgi:hypothetical protein